MRTTCENHRIMDLLLVAVLLSGCILSTSGDVMTKHSVDVQNIFTNFDALIKWKSSLPTVSDHVCVVSVDELNEIGNVLVRNEGHASDSLNADVSIQLSSNCAKLNRLKTEILKLKKDFKVLIAEPISSYNYRTMKTSLESKILQIKNLVDGTKKMESGERLNMVVKLQTDIQSQQNRIFEVLSKMETEQKRLNEASVLMAIEHLQQGKLNEAVDAFTVVTDHENHIERVVTSVYKNGDEIENIVRFMVRLPLRSRENGYKALCEQMKKDNRMLDQHIWVLAGVLASEISRIQEPNRDIINDIMTEIKTRVRNNNLDGVIEILNKPGGLESMKDFLPLLVRTIYEETDKSGVENFLDFLKRISSVRHKLAIINELVLMLKSTGRMRGKDMSMIIFELIKLRNVDRLENRVWREMVEQNLPPELRDLMYDFLCIQNAKNYEYLFTGQQATVDQRFVLTAKVQLNESFYWQVYFTDNGKKVRIRNGKFNSPVYLVDDGHFEDDHALQSSISGTIENEKLAEFTLDMLGNGEFLIINDYFGQMLYSAFNSEPNPRNNRPVLSKKYDPKNIDTESKWIIGVCRVDVEYVF